MPSRSHCLELVAWAAARWAALPLVLVACGENQTAAVAPDAATASGGVDSQTDTAAVEDTRKFKI